MADIYSKINAIMKEIPAIGKDKQNKQQGFAYRGIDDVMNVLFPLLSKYGVFVIPEVLNTSRTERQTKSGGNMAFTVATVKYTFYATDGSSVSAITTGEGMDSADKSTNKAMAAAMKYAFFQTFCIPTEEAAKDDPDGETPEESEPEESEQAYICADCSCVIGSMNKKGGGKMSPADVAGGTMQRYGRMLCPDCWGKEVARAKTSKEPNT